MGEMIMDEPKSAIKHEGNFFIMDSEQLVCNPFADLQSEVMSDVQKKASLTEKLTSVKNNVCDNHYAIKRATLERSKTHTLKVLHDHSSKLRYEVKLLDLDRQKHKIEVKKRVMPERDYSYDETQICNTEKRLGANIASFYLERRMKYPPRLKSVSDISVTPLVQKARQALKENDDVKILDQARSERAQTAKSVTSTLTTASPVRGPPVNFKFNRRNSRSAPLVSRSYGGQMSRDETTRLPAIPGGGEAARGHGGGGGGGVGGGKMGVGGGAGGHVKFMFEDPLKILTSKDKDLDDSASLLSRAYTYHPGMGVGGPHERHRLNSRDFYMETSDDEDDLYLPDHIDLRALLFDREGRHHDEAVSTKSLAHTGNHVPTPILRRSNMYAPKITQDLIQQETDQVQSKVNRFLQELNDHANRHDDSDSDLEDDMFTRAPQYGGGGGGGGGYQRPPPRPSTFHHVPPIHTTKKPRGISTAHHTTNLNTTDDSGDDHALQSARADRRAKMEENKTPRIPKDAWKYIKGRSNDGNLRGTYSAEDLVLQTITGVPLSRSLTAGIPLNSAGRAMRHTATFKMRKVVERLVNERTKYQQHEIEELKRKMESGMDLATAAASLAPGPSAGLSRNPSRMMDPLRPFSQGVQG